MGIKSALLSDDLEAEPPEPFHTRFMLLHTAATLCVLLRVLRVHNQPFPLNNLNEA